MQRNVVVLPQPEGPRREKNSPERTSNEIGPTVTSGEYRRISPLTSSSMASVIVQSTGWRMNKWGACHHRCHPGDGRDPPLPWIPAFAGMTMWWRQSVGYYPLGAENF